MKVRLITLGTCLLLASVSYADGLYVCNETGEPLSIAMARFDQNIWTSSGWFSANNFSCIQLTDKFTNTRYYIYAVGSSGKEWGGNHRFCLNQYAGFQIPNADNTSACNAKGFFSVWTPDMVTGGYPERHAVVLGPNNTSLNHPRAER